MRSASAVDSTERERNVVVCVGLLALSEVLKIENAHTVLTFEHMNWKTGIDNENVFNETNLKEKVPLLVHLNYSLLVLE